MVVSKVSWMAEEMGDETVVESEGEMAAPKAETRDASRPDVLMADLTVGLWAAQLAIKLVARLAGPKVSAKAVS